MAEKQPNLHFEEVQLTSPVKRNAVQGGDGWMTSFADVVTVLLCFFIIFYMAEKQYHRGGGFGSSPGTIQAYKTKMNAPEVLSLIDILKVLPKVKIINTNQFLEVHFPPEMFFGSGQTSLTQKGSAVIDKLIKPLLAIQNGYILQIQGYTDSTPVTNKDSRWWNNNMELSIQRSLEVYNHLIKNGVERKILAVTGFGTNKPLINEAKEMQRRISFKFEPVLDDAK